MAVTEVTEQLDEEAQTEEQVEQEEVEETTEGETAEEAQESEEVTVSLGDEESPPQEEEAKAPEWVRELRKSSREKDKRIRELESQLKTQAQPEKAVELGQKPTLEGCDYDAEKFERDLEQWHERKRVLDAKAREKEEAAKQEKAAWDAQLERYNTAKSALKVSDYEEAESVVLETLSQTQQGILVQGAERPELIVYALGKRPEKAKELASIKDPVKFAFAAARLESQLKVSPRKAPPPPETVVRGSGPSAGTADTNLERLRKEAERTGDYSKVAAYKRQQNAKAA